MKILHVVQGYFPVIGGSENLVKNLSEQMAVNYNDDVTVFTAAATKPIYFWKDEGEAMSAGVEQINGVRVRRFPVSKRFQFMRMIAARGFYRLKLPYHDQMRTWQVGPIIPKLPQAIAESDADVIFATSFPFKHMYDAVKGAKQANRPVVLLGAIHTEDKWGYDRRMMFTAIKQADAYVAHTVFERDFLVARGVDTHKIHVIGGGVAVVDFSDVDNTAVRTKYNLPDGPLIVVMTRQSALKRLDTIVEAMPLVWQVHPEAGLLLAGAKRDYSDKLAWRIAQLPPDRQKKIVQVHDFADEEKPQLLAAGDMLVHTSGYESFGIVFVEAWAAGKPVIGANVGSISSLIDAGKDGLLFEFGDPQSLAQQIITLLNQPAAGLTMGQAGREKVLQNYSWEIVTERLRWVYQQVIDQKSKR